MSETRDDAADPQPAPGPGDGRSVTDALIEAVEARRALGMRKYGGRELTPFNGRDALLDLRDELLDASMYIQQIIMERDAIAEKQGRSD